MDKGFLYKLIGLTLTLAGLIFILNTIHLFDGYVSFVWTSLIFLVCTTIIVYFIMLRALSMKEHSNFVVAFGTGFAIKSFASLLFICYFIFYRPIGNHTFVLPFFFMYFAYTGLLVWDLWHESRKKPLP
jgi:drug/metabolite transporter (DMT)-like permease